MSFYPVPPSSQLVAQEQSLIGSTAPPCHGNWRRFQKACPVARYSASRTTGPTGRGMAGDAGSSGGDGIEMRVANKVTFKCVTWARDIRSPPSTTTPPPGLNDPPHTPKPPRSLSLRSAPLAPSTTPRRGMTREREGKGEAEGSLTDKTVLPLPCPSALVCSRTAGHALPPSMTPRRE